MFKGRSGMKKSNVTVIGENVEVKNTLDLGESIAQVFGVLISGGGVAVKSESDLYLAETSMVEGDVFCDVLDAGGRVKGNIECRRAIIRSGANIKGERITCESIVVEEGASLDIEISMNSAKKAVTRLENDKSQVVLEG